MTEEPKKKFGEKVLDFADTLERTGNAMQKGGKQTMGTGCGCMMLMAILFLPVIIILSMF